MPASGSGRRSCRDIIAASLNSALAALSRSSGVNWPVAHRSDTRSTVTSSAPRGVSTVRTTSAIYAHLRLPRQHQPLALAQPAGVGAMVGRLDGVDCHAPVDVG